MLAALLLHASDAASSSRAARPSAGQTFQALDSGGKGHLTVEDLQAAVVSISAAGVRRADAAGKGAAGAEKLFARLDADGDGQLTQAEFQAAVPWGLGGGGPHGPRGAKHGAPADAAVKAYESVAQPEPDAVAA